MQLCLHSPRDGLRYRSLCDQIGALKTTACVRFCVKHISEVNSCLSYPHCQFRTFRKWGFGIYRCTEPQNVFNPPRLSQYSFAARRDNFIFTRHVARTVEAILKKKKKKHTHTQCLLTRLYASPSFTHINVYCNDFAQFCINGKRFKNIVLVILAPHFW